VGEEFGRIDDASEVETLRGCRRTGASVVPAAQEGRHILRRTTSQPDLYHGANQHSHHPLEKSVGFDMEAHAPVFRSIFPLGNHETAAIMGFVGLGRKGAEVVLAPHDPGGGVQQRDIDWSS
jgi:hypothetical protein